MTQAKTPTMPSSTDAAAPELGPADSFARRHIGPQRGDVEDMLKSLGCTSLDDLTTSAIPNRLRTTRPLAIGPPREEREALHDLRQMARKNQVMRSCIGMGYHHTITPPVILRNILENPGWYTQYTPYQAEISQGRLEALVNFQTMIADLTGLPLAGASLLDEATAAAEAMTMCYSIAGEKKQTFFASADCHPQTLGVLQTRAEPLSINLVIGDLADLDLSSGDVCGVLIQQPNTSGDVFDHAKLADQVHAQGALLVVAADILSLTLITPPGEYGADICVGSAQRFGVPMGAGGPHAAFLATRDEYARRMPGRIIGVSRDMQGNPAYRMAIQTREQHIRREKATSNICTAQALLAIVAGMYGVYHGPDGLRRIATRTHALAAALARGLTRLGHEVQNQQCFFATLRVRPSFGYGTRSRAIADAAREHGINLRELPGGGALSISLDEASDETLVRDLLAVFNHNVAPDFSVEELLEEARTDGTLDFGPMKRTSPFMQHPVFHEHQTETKMLRYIFKLQQKDLSLTHAMIPLGSCTMKLNATSEMIPISWQEFAEIHPFAPDTQWRGYTTLFRQLERWLGDITGFSAVSLQPNAGAQGEYTGLLVIRAYHLARGDSARTVCLIPTSAHGTNPASAKMAGMSVVPVKCNAQGNIDLEDLRAKAEKHADSLAALMVTWPSTAGVFEDTIKDVCEIVHQHGGQVYLDGANLNAQVGLCRPAELGADVCHLNLHKTFCIPHGGGGPGMGPIGVAKHLAPFLPGHTVEWPDSGGDHGIGPVSAAPYGSSLILPISWMYIAMMGSEGLKRASQVAVLNANYMANRLKDHYDILYTGQNGRVAHEFIIDCRSFEKTCGIKIEDIAKRLIDFGFHAPTMSWPVPGTLMIEPTESESRDELDRLCEALIVIRQEIEQVAQGKLPADDNPLRNAPHTVEMVTSDDWPHPYSRDQAAWPASWVKEHKFWPAVARIDNVWGDRHLFCTCSGMDEVAELS